MKALQRKDQSGPWKTGYRSLEAAPQEIQTLVRKAGATEVIVGKDGRFIRFSTHEAIVSKEVFEAACCTAGGAVAGLALGRMIDPRHLGTFGLAGAAAGLAVFLIGKAMASNYRVRFKVGLGGTLEIEASPV